ncbi:caspase family protein [Paenibacillus puerhi]|uniref:caspase family protein n=1 Tax=Paenibacillus puerhi TaxID=2692622 RepID=UPI002E2DE2F6|nr:caspase family protein [Paenibacillus puerhi]
MGINKYQHVGPLGFACNDAQAVASLLVEEFDFPADNVVLLLDENATKANILREFMKHANGYTAADDRIFVFYAGHGHTIPGKRGEIGYLIPVDGKIDDISSFIRWDELTRNSELFQAKHVLFIMDACYGGLAITRSLQPGSTRFLKDMLKRYTRQVLTPGKADEVVADAGGPIPGHSIFTGHLIEALRGKAAQHDETITANGVMSYVYEKVSKDQYSSQTPHFGYFDGDGDFIFKAPILTAVEAGGAEADQMIIVQPVYSGRQHDEDKIIDEVKEYLSEDRYYIKLDDLINRELRHAVGLYGNEFEMQSKFNNEEFVERLKKYENITENIIEMVAAVSYWGTSRYVPCLRKTISRLADLNGVSDGLVVWLKLRWYPILISMYAGGIGAIASQNYEMLATLFLTKVANERRGRDQAALFATISELNEVHDAFKTIPDYERNYVPRSEYLFKMLQPQMDDLFFLGKSYEDIFDKYEILQALVYADLYDTQGYGIWGPPGRFAWKHRSIDDSPFKLLLAEAEALKEEWPPLKSGLFRGSYDRFKQISDEYLSLVAKLSWY